MKIDKLKRKRHLILLKNRKLHKQYRYKAIIFHNKKESILDIKYTNILIIYVAIIFIVLTLFILDKNTLYDYSIINCDVCNNSKDRLAECFLDKQLLDLPSLNNKIKLTCVNNDYNSGNKNSMILNEINNLHLKNAIASDSQNKIAELETQIRNAKRDYLNLVIDLNDLVK